MASHPSSPARSLGGSQRLVPVPDGTPAGDMPSTRAPSLAHGVSALAEARHEADAAIEMVAMLTDEVKALRAELAAEKQLSAQRGSLLETTLRQFTRVGGTLEPAVTGDGDDGDSQRPESQLDGDGDTKEDSKGDGGSGTAGHGMCRASSQCLHETFLCDVLSACGPVLQTHCPTGGNGAVIQPGSTGSASMLTCTEANGRNRNRRMCTGLLASAGTTSQLPGCTMRLMCVHVVHCWCSAGSYVVHTWLVVVRMLPVQQGRTGLLGVYARSSPVVGCLYVLLGLPH